MPFGQGYAYGGETLPAWEQPQAPASTPGSFTSTYGGGTAPKDSNIDDYWTGTGYSEIGTDKNYQPYDQTNTYQYGNLPTDTWANANTYAPWAGYGPGGNEATPGELSQWTNLDNQAYRGGDSTLGDWGAFGAGTGVGSGIGSLAMAAPMIAPGAGLLAIAGNKAGAFDRKKKRSDPQFSAPSYQGMMFTPEEGFPSYYQPSQETQNQTQQQLYDQPNEFAYQQPQQQGYDYNYTGGMTQPGTTGQQNYVGQQEQEYGSFYNKDRGGIYDTFTL